MGSEAEIDLGTFHSELISELRTRVHSPVIYDLGCGQAPEPDCIGLDLFSTGERIRKCDLYDFPWTVDGEVIPDESVDYLVATHFLEHVPDWEAHFREVYRVLKMGGCYKIISPYYLSVRATMDPDHKQPISEHRFLYLNQEWMKKNNRNHYGIGVGLNFRVLNDQYFYAYNQDFVGKEDMVQAFARAHYFNAVDDLALVLKKLPLEE